MKETFTQQSKLILKNPHPFLQKPQPKNPQKLRLLDSVSSSFTINPYTKEIETEIESERDLVKERIIQGKPLILKSLLYHLYPKK